MKTSEALDAMYKQADHLDDHYARVRAGDYNFSNKQKVITGAGAAIGGLGMGFLQNYAINKQIKNAQKKQETARTDASRMRWERIENNLKKSKKGRIAGSAISGALLGAAVPGSIFSTKNINRKNADWNKAWDADAADRQKEWDNMWKQRQQAWEQAKQQRQQAWDDFFKNYQNTYSGGHSSSSSGHTQARDVSGNFSAFGINKDQFKTKADFNKWHKSQMKKYHPDLNPNNPAAEEMSKRINDFADEVKKSDWFLNKLAFMLLEKNMEKQAALGAVLSQGAKLGSRLLSSNTGKAMLSSAGKSAMQGAIMSGASSQPGQDGKNHWIKNSLKGAAIGAGIGAAGVGVQKAIPRMPEFGAKVKTTFKSAFPTPGATVPPVQKPASVTT